MELLFVEMMERGLEDVEEDDDELCVLSESRRKENVPRQMEHRAPCQMLVASSRQSQHQTKFPVRLP